MRLAVVAAISALAILLVAPLAVSLSLFAAVTALLFPQYIASSKLFSGSGETGKPFSPFSLWAAKFSLTILLLALSLRLLSESGLLAAPYFIFGVVAGVAFNLLLLARLSRQSASRQSAQHDQLNQHDEERR